MVMDLRKTNLVLLVHVVLAVLSAATENVYFDKQITINQNQTFFIAEPLSFTRVVERKIVSQGQPLRCNFVNPQLQLTILAQYRLSNLQTLKEKFLELKQKIISASFDWDDKVWLLVNDGSVVQLKLNSLAKQFKTVKKYYPDKSVGISGRFFGEIYTLGDHIFVKYKGLFYSISFKDNSWQLEYQYTVEPVTRVKFNKEELYFITHQNLYRIQKDKTYKRLSCIGKTYFKDFDVDQNNLLALTSVGILSVNKANFYYEGMEKIEHIQQARKIRISQKFMVIYFKRKEQEIILEYYLQKMRFQSISPVNQRRYLEIEGSYVRQGKLHRQYKRVENIIMNTKYAIVQQKFQISFFQVNIHTKNPIPLKENQITLKKQNIIGLQWQEDQIFMFQDNKVKLFTIQNSFFKKDLFRGVLNCVAEQESAAQLQVQYKGMCSSDNFQKTSWQCQELVTYTLNIQSNQFFELFSKLQIFLLILLLSSAVIAGLFYHKIVLKFTKEIENIKSGKEKPKSQELNQLREPENKAEAEENK